MHRICEWRESDMERKDVEGKKREEGREGNEEEKREGEGCVGFFNIEKVI